MQGLYPHRPTVHHVIVERGVRARLEILREGSVVFSYALKYNALRCGNFSDFVEDDQECVPGFGHGADIADRQPRGGGHPSLSADEGELVPNETPDIIAEHRVDASSLEEAEKTFGSRGRSAIKLPEDDPGGPTRVRDHSRFGYPREDERRPTEDVFLPDGLGDEPLVLDAVLQGHDRCIGSHEGVKGRNRGFVVVRLDA